MQVQILENNISQLELELEELTEEYNNISSYYESLKKNHQILLEQGSPSFNELFWSIASTPFEAFKSIWTVEVLGVNIANFALGLVCVVILIGIVKRFI